MFKTLFLLIRGSAASAAEEIADRNALLILDQQMREAGSAIERSKRALALAIAQDGTEAKRLDAAIVRIADLEVRIKAALEAGNRDLRARAPKRSPLWRRTATRHRRPARSSLLKLRACAPSSSKLSNA